MAKEEVKLKVVLLGAGAVGKTSLVKRYVHSRFSDEYTQTIGTTIYKKDFDLSTPKGEVKIVMTIWDVMGQKVFPKVITSSLRDAQGVLFVSDLTRKETLGDLEKWVHLVFDNTSDVAFSFIGNKSDLSNVQFGLNALEEVARSFKAPSLITSAKTGDGVEEAFAKLGAMIYRGKTITKPPELTIERNFNNLPPLLLAEDNIIHTYCNKSGGYEATMPVIRNQIERLGMDFRSPTKEQLEQLIDKLVQMDKDVKGEEEARKLKRELLRFLQ